jgi:hypothetical protein
VGESTKETGVDSGPQVGSHVTGSEKSAPSQVRREGRKFLAKSRRTQVRFTVPEVWRKIVKKNERQGDGLFDVLICNHAVPANDNTYRKGRSCPVCRVQVQKYADELPPANASVRPAQAPGRTRRRKIAA